MMQQVIVGIIVLMAAWIVARKYLPKPVRRRVSAITARAARRIWMRSLARWLETDLPAASSCADGCGSCGNCGPTAMPNDVTFAISADALKQTIKRR